MSKILVIGDSCIDIFKYGEVNRLAPEAPIPIIVPETEKSNPGMAGNVVENLKALGAEVTFITNHTEIKKIRYVCSKYNHLLLRVDENDKCEHVNFYHDLTLLDWKQYGAIVISDYCKGFLNEEDIKYISTQHPLTFLDTKKLLGNWADNITFIKLNSIEYNQNKEILSSSSTLFSKGIKDVSGAGDTFLAGLVAEYAKSSNIESAIKFAQECTTVVVQKSGVSTI